MCGSNKTQSKPVVVSLNQAFIHMLFVLLVWLFNDPFGATSSFLFDYIIIRDPFHFAKPWPPLFLNQALVCGVFVSFGFKSHNQTRRATLLSGVI
jgi:hypothetical protein